jgi:hypothetical protein
MLRLRMLLAVCLLVPLGVLSPTAAAATSPGYAVSGIELAATSTQGTFAGSAQGSAGDHAIWKAVVQHQALSSGCWTSGCAISSGGSFSLLNGQLSTISGSFTGGSIKLIGQAPGCGLQQFDVTGNLTTSAGAGLFHVTLTHYRVQLFGSCVSYFATVSGNASFGG